MGRALISPENSLWRNVAGAIAAAFLVPLAIIAKLISMPFEKPRQRSIEDVARYLRRFLDDAGDERAWDDFTSIPIADAHLESIRQRAAEIDLPISEEGRSTLRALLQEAEAKEPQA